MSGSHRLSKGERELELALARIQPAPTTIDRDKLLFRAGQMAGRRRLRVWMAAAAVLAVCACLSLAIRPKPRVVERVVFVDRPAETTQARAVEPAGVAPTGASYLDVRQAIAERGIDAAWDDSRLQETGGPTQADSQSRLPFFGLMKYIEPAEGDGE